ncbi:MAG: hypothetical protein P8Y18_00385 [Candidatus Bathyarchaeota archaeon]
MYLKEIRFFVSIFILIILIYSINCSVFGLQIESSLSSSSDHEPFYVGVTYCGDSVAEAKQLIDKVKDYTNLFVIQSGSLQFGHRLDELKQIIDYVVDSDLYFIVYLGNFREFLDGFFGIFDPLWENYFLGIYFGDEPAGKMLDEDTNFLRGSSQDFIDKRIDGSVKVTFNTISPYEVRDPKITYYKNGTIFVEKDDSVNSRIIYATYHTNGSISVKIRELIGSSVYYGDKTDIPYSFETVQNMYPFNSYSETADLFVDLYQSILNETKEYDNVAYFTSDYVLHWFDYKAGYDVVLAQFGWNHTLAQDIALVRGAANLQQKDWGAIITWKYNNPPYLDTGEVIYNQMKTAYESGAKYVVVFNYAENMSNTYGTLQDEHFGALEQFWNDVVQNPSVEHGSIEGEAVLVLPKNYGWGMRNFNDTIWGIHDTDEKSEQIWNLRSSLFEEYGLKLDIVFNDPEFSVEGKYNQTYYAAIEKNDQIPTTWVAIVLIGSIIVAVPMLYFAKIKKPTNKIK